MKGYLKFRIKIKKEQRQAIVDFVQVITQI